MKIVYFGSDDYSAEHLKFMVDSGFGVKLVVTQPDKPKGRGKKVLPTPVKKIAVKKGIEVITPMKVSEIHDVLREYDIGILVSFGKIIPEKILSAPRLGIFNVHPSLLPRYRGASPINRALESGDKETGVTLMKVSSKLDAGPIVLQRRIEIGDFESFGDLEKKLIEEGKKILSEFFKIVESGEIPMKEQDESKATYAPKITKEDLIVDFSKPCEFVKNKIRAYDPKPGAFSNLNGNVVKLFGVKDIRYGESSPGEIASVEREGAWIGCRDGEILVERIQFPGKKPVGFFDAKNGRKLKEGDRFTPPEL